MFLGYIINLWSLNLNILCILGHTTVFDLINVRLTGPGIEKEKIKADGMLRCTVFCTSNAQCQSVSYEKETEICYMHHVTFTSPGVVLDYNLKFTSTELPGGSESETLVFRATAGIGAKTFGSWNDEGHDDVGTVTIDSFGCLSVNNQLPCDRHFRSWRLDQWSNISKNNESVQNELVLSDLQVRARRINALDTRYHEYASEFFNATGTTHRNEVFQVSRIIEASVAELIGYNVTHPFNSIQGFPICKRRFFIFSHLIDCDNDYAWMAVLDGAGNPFCCDYDKTGPHPKFIYTKTNNSVNFGDAGLTEFAQVFAVFITYGSN